MCGGVKAPGEAQLRRPITRVTPRRSRTPSPGASRLLLSRNIELEAEVLRLRDRERGLQEEQGEDERQHVLAGLLNHVTKLQQVEASLQTELRSLELMNAVHVVHRWRL